MTSRRYQPVLNRQQEMLLPPCVDEYVSRNNPVRAIDAYVNTLDLQALDFTNSQPVMSAGQPAYDPAALLKLYFIVPTLRRGNAVLDAPASTSP